MTDYEIRFKKLLKNTVIGFAIGLILSTVFIVSRHYAFGESIVMILCLTVLIGSLASVIISAKSGLVVAANGLITSIFKGIITACFKVPTGSGILFAIRIVKAIIGFLLLIPLCLYIVISYPVNLIYLGIMTIFERKGMLEEKASVIKILDILVPIISIILVIIICSFLFSGNKRVDKKSANVNNTAVEQTDNIETKSSEPVIEKVEEKKDPEPEESLQNDKEDDTDQQDTAETAEEIDEAVDKDTEQIAKAQAEEAERVAGENAEKVYDCQTLCIDGIYYGFATLVPEEKDDYVRVICIDEEGTVIEEYEKFVLYSDPMPPEYGYTFDTTLKIEYNGEGVYLNDFFDLDGFYIERVYSVSEGKPQFTELSGELDMIDDELFFMHYTESKGRAVTESGDSLQYGTNSGEYKYGIYEYLNVGIVDGKIIEYAAKDCEESELEKYKNYNDIKKGIEDKLKAGDFIRLDAFEGTEIENPSVRFEGAMKDDSGKYFLNYDITGDSYGCTYEYHRYYTLKPNGDELVLLLKDTDENQLLKEKRQYAFDIE